MKKSWSSNKNWYNLSTAKNNQYCPIIQLSYRRSCSFCFIDPSIRKEPLGNKVIQECFHFNCEAFILVAWRFPENAKLRNPLGKQQQQHAWLLPTFVARQEVVCSIVESLLLESENYYILQKHIFITSLSTVHMSSLFSL